MPNLDREIKRIISINKQALQDEVQLPAWLIRMMTEKGLIKNGKLNIPRIGTPEFADYLEVQEILANKR